MPIIAKISIAAILAAAIYFVAAKESIREDFNAIFSAPLQSSQAQILFAGDLMFDRNIRYFSQKYGNEYIFEKIDSLLQNSDLAVANLEGPITNEKSKSWNTHPGDPGNCIFTFPAGLAGTLFKENIKLVSLANNHILDFGNGGLESTKERLVQAGVEYFGEPHGKISVIKEIKGVKIAFAGYNGFYPSAIVDEIKKTREAADIIVVFSHWGQEYAKEPNQAVKDLARSFIDAGADLVIGSHPHVIQTIEDYNGKRIYYSLGNFVFDQYFSEDVKRGLGVVVKIDSATKQMQFEEVDFYLQENGQTVLK